MADKKLMYQIEITLETDGDFSFRKNLLPPDFLVDDSREIITCTDDTLVCKIYDKDMTASGWKPGEWGKMTARHTIEEYVSAIHVSFTHLYIWEDLLRCVDETSRWIYYPETSEDEDLHISSISGNYEGTEFIIRRIREDT